MSSEIPENNSFCSIEQHINFALAIIKSLTFGLFLLEMQKKKKEQQKKMNMFR